MKNKVRVKPEYKQTQEGIPIPNPDDDARREQMHEHLKAMWDASCAFLDSIDQFKNSMKREDFLEHSHYHMAIADCIAQKDDHYEIHEWLHANHVAVGWTEWKSINVDKCDTTSNTSTKEAS